MPEQNADLARKIMDIGPRVARVMRLAIREFPAPRISLPQYRILGAVARGKNRASELCDLQGVSGPSMSRHIEAMVEGGLLKRTRSSSDRRQVILELSDKGMRKFQAVHEAALKELSARLSRLSGPQTKILNHAIPLLEATLL